MILKALQSGTFPSGCHWSAGKVRDVNIPKGAEIPSWLVEVKAAKPKGKKKSSNDEG